MEEKNLQKKGRVPLTPLIETERLFAQENHYIIMDYLKRAGLNQDDWYDIVCIGFLQAVKKWFVREDLHKYYFRTIAYQAMRSAVGNERKKLEKEIQTISLDQELPDTDGYTLMDTITHENLELIYTGGQSMNISYNVFLPERTERGGQKSKEALALESFITMKDKKNMCFEYETKDEAKKKLGLINRYKRRKNHADIYDAYKVNNRIYVVKKEKKQ